MICITQPVRSTSHSSLGRPLVIGIVNNTSDRALASTEAQFTRLLHLASRGVDIRLRFFVCANIPRSTPPTTASGEAYRDIRELSGSGVDGLIITGMEPQADRLEDEPAWSRLTELLDWAERRNIPTVCSCLAAHIAVSYQDGIPRSRQADKLSDIVDCELTATGHPLARGLPPRWSIPHSRYYGIVDTSLAAKGYQVLSRSARAGVDMFTKDSGGQFLYFQGHPEYDPDTLLREYKRDVRRFLTGERDDYPLAPARYFDDEAAYALSVLRRDAIRGRRDLRVLDEVRNVMRGTIMPTSWEAVARRIYFNWLDAAVQPNAFSQAANPPQLEVAIAQAQPHPVHTGVGY